MYFVRFVITIKWHINGLVELSVFETVGITGGG